MKESISVLGGNIQGSLLIHPCAPIVGAEFWLAKLRKEE